MIAWAPFAQEVFAETIRDSESPVQKIFNSQIFSSWFADDVKLHGDGPQTTSLSAAKHRFASFAKPAGRIMLHVKSLFRVLHRVAAMRTDASWARKWLAGVTSKKLLLLALAADAADSLLQLTRFLDAENVDPASLNEEIGNFMSELHAQFIHGRAWEIEGYYKAYEVYPAVWCFVCVHPGTMPATGFAGWNRSKCVAGVQTLGQSL